MVTREQIIKFLILHTSDLQFNSLFCHARALAFLMEGLLVLMDTKTSKYAPIYTRPEPKEFHTEIIHDIKYKQFRINILLT